ncbi:MAG TPA: biopolymer transporter ExbD [Rhodocyclaceae bacterium]|nr:biopolymer transporter ExbD [Rhodocyclaceae bacterium]
MAFGSFNEGGAGQPMAEINTTPLVDVMLVLLVIFIITAPLFHQAVPIDLPKVDATKLEEKPEVIQMAVDAEGVVFWNGEAVHREALETRFAAVSERQPELHLRADRAVRYERVAEVMAAAQKAGVVKIAFVTEPNR